MAIADTIGDAMCGAHLRSAEIIREVVRARQGVPEATVWGSKGFKTDCADAARVNSVMSETLPLCESHMQAVTHATYAIVPAALGLGERTGAEGKEVIAAVALGYEIAGRVGISIAPSYIWERGFHTSVVTVLGSATAAGKLLGLNEDQVTHTIALAATFAGGLAESRKTAAREYHAGTATLLGIHAALAAQGGYEGEETILEKPQGYCETFSTQYNLAAITADLGEEWDVVTDMAFKFIPTSHGIHAPVEATIALVKSDNIHPSEVERVAVIGSSWLKGYLIYHPQSSPGASHSMPYCVASSIVDREFSWHHMEVDKITRQEVQGLQDRVELVDSGSYEYPGGTTVIITTTDGKEHSHSVDLPIGMPQRGYGWSQIEEKYRALFPKGGLPDHKGKTSLELLKHLEGLGNISELTPHLVP